jgi:hypothetical protein
MGFFKSKKGSIISDHFKLIENIGNFTKGYMYEVALYNDHLEVISLQKKKLILNYNQITDVFYGMETELKSKPKSVIGRAAVGGILFGGVGAVVGAISGNGQKKIKERYFYFIISFNGSDGQDGYLQFEDTRLYKGLKLSQKLKELTNQYTKPQTTEGTRKSTNSFNEPLDKLNADGELPWGWIAHNKEFTDKIQKEYSHFLHEWIDSRNQSPEELYTALKSFVLYMKDIEKLCSSKGECFEFWFREILTGKDYLKTREKELTKLEETLKKS